MKYEDLSFTEKDEKGIEFINDITHVIPNSNNEEEPYVIYTDYTFDENDDFKKYYGKLVYDNGNYCIDKNLSKMEIAYINNNMEDEIVKYVNEVIGENLSE